MAVKFRKRIKIISGVNINLSSKGASVSLGGRGASINIGKKGIYGNLSLPGSGLSYRTKLSSNERKNAIDLAQNSINESITIRVRINDDGTIEYLNSNDDSYLPNNIVASFKKNNKETLISMFKEACQKFNDGLEQLDKIHLTALPPSDTRIYHVKTFSSPPPKKQLRQPTLLSKILPFVEKKRLKINDSLESEYIKKLNIWNTNKEEFEKNEEIIANKINILLASGDEDTVNSELVTLLSNIHFPKETNVNFELNQNNLILDIDLPEIEDIPDKKYTASESSLRISVKTISDTEKRKIYMTHIHSIIFRIIADVFGLIPTIEKITLSAYSQRPNVQTGEIEDQYLVSVNVEKSSWKSINFNNIENINVVECFEQFELVRNMTKTGLFKPIIPFATLNKDNDEIEEDLINKFQLSDNDENLNSQLLEPQDQVKKLIHPNKWLIIGITLFPYIFSWFTLNKGYSNLVRLISFIWMIVFIAICISD